MLRGLMLAAVVLCGVGAPQRGWAQEASPAPGSGDRPTARPYTGVYPLDAVADASGTVYVVDRNLPGVWRYRDGQATVFVQGNRRYRQAMNASRCLALSPQGELFVGDTATRDVYRIDDQGQFTATLDGLIGIPMDLAFASDGTLYIADLERRAVWRKKPGDGKPEPFLPKANARGVFVDAKDRLWVVSQNVRDQLLRYEADGSGEKVIVSEPTFEFPHQVVVDTQGTAWVSDGYKRGVWKVSEDGKAELAVASNGLQNPVGLFLVDDRPAIVDSHAMAVFKMTADGGVEPWFQIKEPERQ